MIMGKILDLLCEELSKRTGEKVVRLHTGSRILETSEQAKYNDMILSEKNRKPVYTESKPEKLNTPFELKQLLSDKILKMCDNFYWRYRDSMFRREEREGGLLTESWLADFITDKAPKSILKDENAILYLILQFSGLLGNADLDDTELEELKKDIKDYHKM